MNRQEALILILAGETVRARQASYLRSFPHKERALFRWNFENQIIEWDRFQTGHWRQSRNSFFLVSEFELMQKPKEQK